MGANLHKLPPQPMAFFGREDELAQIADRLEDTNCRLLTLVGPGGIGKTRLAIQYAQQNEVSFPDGIWFIPLASAESSLSIAPAIAGCLDLFFSGPEDPEVVVTHFLQDKHLLLILDNLEHLLAGVDFLIRILTSAPGVKILATSRERLNLQEEWAILLEGLPFPTDAAMGSLNEYSSLQLFSQRAQQIIARFSVDANMAEVARICQLVEGMPLAIEISATWLRLMSCRQIADRIEKNYSFLSTPLRNVAERHRNIRSVFESSWNMLSSEEQRVFASLSVFRGGFDLEAAGHVVHSPIKVIAELVDKSLVRRNLLERYDLHELLRQFAAEKLITSGESEMVHRRHLEYLISLAELAEANITGSLLQEWFDRIEAEHDNLRAALEWSLEHEEVELGLRLAGSLGPFWELRRHIFEGYEWLKRLLEHPVQAGQSRRLKLLGTATAFAYYLGDLDRVKAYCEENLALARLLNDPESIAWALHSMGHFLYFPYNAKKAEALLSESLALFQQIGSQWGINRTLRRYGWLLTALGEYERARSMLEECLAQAYKTGNPYTIAWGLMLNGNLAWYESHDAVKAKAFYLKSLALSDVIHDNCHLALQLAMLGVVERALGERDISEAYFKQSIRLLKDWTGLDNFTAYGLAGIGSLALDRGQPERATKLFSAASAIWDRCDHPPFGPRADFEQDVACARQMLSGTSFASLWAEGQRMGLDQAMAEALDEVKRKQASYTRSADMASINPVTVQALPEPLTDRELEVLRLLSKGLSNAEIAEKLCIAVGTVKTHLRNINGKLNASSRSKAVAQAQQLHLL